MPQVSTQIFHAQTIGTQPEGIPGEPGAIGFGQPGDPNANTLEEDTHVEPDSTPGEDTNPDANTPVHPEGMGPDVLLVEDGTAQENAGIEGDKDPHVELQEPGVSHPTTPEDNVLLILSSPPHIIPEAASMQRSPVISTMTPGILEPDRRADLELPHDTPPPTTFEAASMQRLPAVNTRTPAIQIQRVAQIWCRCPHGH